MGAGDEPLSLDRPPVLSGLSPGDFELEPVFTASFDDNSKEKPMVFHRKLRIAL
jgi:hypothetical protein